MRVALLKFIKNILKKIIKILKLCKKVSGKLEHKLQATVPVLRWENGNKKRKISSFLNLIAKMYDISFHWQFLAGVCWISRNNLFGQEKVFQIGGVIWQLSKV